MRIFLVFTFLFVAYLANAQNNQDQQDDVKCGCVFNKNLVWNYNAIDTFYVANCQCDLKDMKIKLYNRWGLKLIDEKELFIVKSKLAQTLTPGTYFGVMGYVNQLGTTEEYSFSVTVY